MKDVFLKDDISMIGSNVKVATFYHEYLPFVHKSIVEKLINQTIWL